MLAIKAGLASRAITGPIKAALAVILLRALLVPVVSFGGTRGTIGLLGRFIGPAVLWLPGFLIRWCGPPLALSGRSWGILARAIVRVRASSSIFPRAIDRVAAQPWARGPG